MRRALALAAVLAVALAGCAVPRWVPFVGASKTPGPAPRVAADPVPPQEEPAAPPARPSGGRGLAGLLDDGVHDRVVAVVNNDAITLGELLEAIAVYRQENRQATVSTDDDLARQFLPRLIDTRLQLQEAEREKINAEDAEVEEELAELARKVGAKTPDEFAAVVRGQGLDMEALRKRVRERVRMTKVVRRKVGQRVTVTESEVTQYLVANREKLETGLAYHARHMLIVPQGSWDAAWAEARDRAEALYAQLVGGADFAALAREHSGDATAADGGDLGTLKRGELAQEIEAQIVGLEPGQTSRPHRTALGWHIFRLESKETLEGEALTRVRQQVRDILFREKYEARLQVWMGELKRRAVIDVRL